MAENIVELSIPAPDASITNRARAVLAAASDFPVTTPDQYQSAGEELLRIKAKVKDLNEQRFALTRPIDESKRRIVAFFDEPLRFLSSAEQIIKAAMISYQQQQERLRLEEQRKADEAARKERERLAERAAKAEAAGKAERAQALAEQAQTVVAPVIHREPPKVSGVSMREIWKFRIVDASKVPDEYKVVDEKRVGAVVRALKGDTKIPGIEAYPEKSMAAGATR